MKTSSERILTTHVGSLPRPDDAVALLLRKDRGEAYDQAEFDRVMRRAVADIVKRQVEIGLDVVSDGETSKIGYATYIKDRFNGFGGDFTPKPHLDLADHPEFRKRMTAFLGSQTFRRLTCIAPVSIKDRNAAKFDVENFRSALDFLVRDRGFSQCGLAGRGLVVSAQSLLPKPRSLHRGAGRRAMQPEYEAIANAGLLLQIDCPDVAMSRHTGFQDLSEADFLKRAAFDIEALNHALANIPADQVRVHVCWGNYEGPHDHDIALEKILPIVLRGQGAGDLI